MKKRNRSREMLDRLKEGYVYDTACIETKLLRMANMPIKEYFESDVPKAKMLSKKFAGKNSAIEIQGKEIPADITLADWAAAFLEDMPRVRKGREEKDGPYAAWVWKFFAWPIDRFYHALLTQSKKGAA